MPNMQGVVRGSNMNFGIGTEPSVSLTKSAALGVADMSARFQQAVLRGGVYSFTDASGRATALATATALVGPAIYNPLASNVNLVLWYAGVEVTVAAAGAAVACLVRRVGTGAAAVTGTVSTLTANRLSSGSAGTCQALTTPTLDAAGVIIDTMGVQTTAALTVNSPWPTLGKWFDGSVICGPNTSLSINTLTTAFAAASAFTTFIWEEVAI